MISNIKGQDRYYEVTEYDDQEFYSRTTLATGDQNIGRIKRIKGNTEVANNELVNFKGTSLKTHGKNLVNWGDITLNASTSDKVWSYEMKSLVGIGSTVTISFDVVAEGNTRLEMDFYPDTITGVDKRFLVTTTSIHYVTTVTLGGTFNNWINFRFWRLSAQANYAITISNLQIEYGSVETDYEAYEGVIDILSIPTLTYFSNGMMSVNDVYDELTQTKAIQRLGIVDLGSLSWEYQSAGTRFQATLTSQLGGDSDYIPNILCSLYTTTSPNNTWNTLDDVISCNDHCIFIRDTDYTDATSFASAMSGVYLIYELATPIETDIWWDDLFNVEEGCSEILLPIQNGSSSSTKMIADMQYLEEIVL